MYNWLTGPTKKRVIKELRDILNKHPKYRADAQNVQDKYSFNERPQRGIILNGTSSDRIRLSANNYVGRLISFVQLAPVENNPGSTIEWVRENQRLLEEVSPRRDIFPSPPGVYITEVLELPDQARGIPGKFSVDPILTVINEPLITFLSTSDKEAQLSNKDIYPGSVRLWLDHRRALLEDVDFTVDYGSGFIQFLKEPPPGGMIYADYRHKSPLQGPFPFNYEEFDVTSIPGAVLAFGDRAEKCDKQAVVVFDERVETAEIFGGKFETNFDLLVFTRDSEDRNRMSDFVITEFLNMQNILGDEGIELLDISPGGETEEIYNETEDDYFYDTPVSLSLRVDWETHAPLPINVSRAEFTSQTSEEETGYLDGTSVLDLLRLGRESELIGLRTSIGKGLGFERVIGLFVGIGLSGILENLMSYVF
jgi:hypothetical protein